MRVRRYSCLCKSEGFRQADAADFSTGAVRQVSNDVYRYGHHETGQFLPAMLEDFFFSQVQVGDNSSVHGFTIHGIGYTEGDSLGNAGEFEKDIVDLCRGDFFTAAIDEFLQAPEQ